MSREQEILDALDDRATEWWNDSEEFFEHGEQNRGQRAKGHSMGLAGAVIMVKTMLEGYTITKDENDE